ncbi:uncharacterized protein LOC108905101 [Anoplophora glabripennis]|nr:uncharacterized protein LOC108905101 [Anoplophora glabripennis]XP_018563393.1 uncharacterized protein LOC108905101 [Anoplophora glabripennis]XP_018563394.1 uncharacterized protein LOC108905101 [Anoplophora glabripennis]
MSSANVKDQNQPRKEMKSTGLKKCFTALVDRKQVNLDIDVLNLMLKKELLINLDVLDKNLAEVLPVMLVMYMKTWPGWQRSKEYFSGKLNFKDWYEKFRQYIVVRLNYLIKNGYASVIEEMKREKKRDVDRLNPIKTYTEHGSQTDALAPKSFAPFSICINCPPSVVNSVVFGDSEDDIILRHHPELLWTNIDTMQLIHWPFIEVEFFTPELSFKRRNCFEYTRYINFTNIPLTYDKCEYIDQIEIIDPSNGRNCYTLNMLRCYVKEYMSILKSVKDIDVDVLKVGIILNQFLADIEEINMNNTMATNTSVVFNIGRSVFLRNKKISRASYTTKGPNNPVGYSEIIVPKVETSLIFFKGVQDLNTPEVSFSYLNIIKNCLKSNDVKSAINPIKPLIIYKCSFCQLNLKEEAAIIKHLQEVHKMDPNVICIKCKKSLSVCLLSSVRWKHICTTNPISLQQHSKQVPITLK